MTVHAYTPKAVKRAIDAGVKCIEHGQLLDEETIKLLADKGIWLSLQALDEAPPTQTKLVREKNIRWFKALKMHLYGQKNTK